MKTPKQILYALFIVFAAVNLYALYFGGWKAMVDLVVEANPWAIVVTMDLFISLGLICTWIYQDSRENKRSALGYIILAFTTGSFGPLLYLINRQERQTT